MAEYTKPLPIPDESTEEFWQNARAHRLVFQRCQSCQAFAHPPVGFCDHCHDLANPSFAFEPVSGRGTIVNWTVMYDPMVTGFGKEEPWVNVLVRMDEQDDLMFMATLEDGRSAGLALNAPVEVTFKDVTPNVTIPYFRLAGGAAR